MDVEMEPELMHGYDLQGNLYNYQYHFEVC